MQDKWWDRLWMLIIVAMLYWCFVQVSGFYRESKQINAPSITKME